MRKGRQSGRADKPLVDIAIIGSDNFRDCPITLCQPVKNGAFAHLPMRLQAAEKDRRILNCATMAGQEQAFAALNQFVQRSHEITHRPVRRRNHRCRPRHHMIGGEQDLFFNERKSEMIGGVSRRGYGLQGPVRSTDLFHVLQDPIRPECMIGASVKRIGLPDMKITRRPMWPFRKDRRAGDVLQSGGARRVITVSMADKNVRDFAAACGGHQRINVLRIIRSRINNRHFPSAYKIGVCAAKGERPGVAGRQPTYARRYLYAFPMLRIEIGFERKAHMCSEASRLARPNLHLYRTMPDVGRDEDIMTTSAAPSPLVGRLVPAESASRLLVIIFLAVAGSLLIWASAKIKVPFYPVPVTMQVFAIMALAATYGFRLGLATILLYMAEGAAGIPVFTGTPEKGIGLVYMMGTTGGYLVGFVLATALVGWFAERGFDRNPFKLFAVMLAGSIIIMGLGVLWLGLVLGWDKPVLEWGLYPFILPDLTKIALASCLVPAVWRLINRA